MSGTSPNAPVWGLNSKPPSSLYKAKAVGAVTSTGSPPPSASSVDTVFNRNSTSRGRNSNSGVGGRTGGGNNRQSVGGAGRGGSNIGGRGGSNNSGRGGNTGGRGGNSTGGRGGSNTGGRGSTSTGGRGGTSTGGRGGSNMGGRGGRTHSTIGGRGGNINSSVSTSGGGGRGSPSGRVSSNGSFDKGNSHSHSGRGSNQIPNRRDSHKSQQHQPQEHLANEQSSQQQQQQDSVKRTPYFEIFLLNSTGMGNSEEEKSVIRCSVTTFMNCRLDHLQTPPLVPSKGAPEVKPGDDGIGFCWTPIPQCTWNNDSVRVAFWQADMERLWNYKPLDIDPEKRWRKPDDEEGEALRRAVGILNKLSWTTLDKLTLGFLQCLGLSSVVEVAAATNATTSNNGTAVAAASLDKKLVQNSMALILDKAMAEPHFAELYAHFSNKLAAVHKVFKRALLSLCEEQFKNTDSSPSKSNISSGGQTLSIEEKAEFEASVGAVTDEKTTEIKTNNERLPAEEDPVDLEYKAALAKKKYLGLMQFIGELYKLSMIKANIVAFCLQELFVKVDEEKLECFAKLMTTIGEKLDKEDDIREQLETVWDDVYSMAGRHQQKSSGAAGSTGPKAPNNRIKFLLQDLSDLRDGGWRESQRQQDAKAKTIAQIHQEVAMKEQQQKQQVRPMPLNKNKVTRSQSVGTSLNNRSADLTPSSLFPVTDSHGFQRVQHIKPPKSSVLRRVQSDAFPTKDDNAGSYSGSSLDRAVATASSTGGSSNEASRNNNPSNPDYKFLDTSDQRTNDVSTTAVSKKYLSPDECATKMEKLLQEYFVGGETADAVLSVDELVGARDIDNLNMRDDVITRGGAVVRAGILLVLERKEVEVSKFLTIVRECCVGSHADNEEQQQQRPILPIQCLALGLREPMELLRDVEIDAPKAPALLTQIIVDWMCASTTNTDINNNNQSSWLDVTDLFLKQTTEYFRTECRPADLAKQVLRRYHEVKADDETTTTAINDQEDGTDATPAVISEDKLQMVAQLMSEDERIAHPNIREWILST